MASLFRLATVARRHLLRDHGHREKKGETRDGEISPRERKSGVLLHVRRDKENIETQARGIYPVTSRKKPADEKRKRAGSIYARKAWAKLPLISENTRRISGLIRRRLTAPIRSSGFALARRSSRRRRSARQNEGRIPLINLPRRSSSQEH